MRFIIPTFRTAARAFALAAVFALAPAAYGQDCELPDDNVPFPTGPVCNVAPMIDVTPPGGTVSQAAVAVTITAMDHFNGNDFGSLRILLDGADVTSQWTWTHTDAGAGTGLRRTYRTSGTVTLSDSLAERTLEVRMSDAAQETRESRTWTLVRPGVEVGPEGTALVEPPAVSRTTPFTVTNTGVATATFALTAECRDAQGQWMTPCEVPATRTLPAKGSTVVNATYPAYGEGGMVTVMVRARQTDAPGVEDAGWTDVAIRSWGGPPAGTPQLALVPLNAGAGVERGQCVTVATARRGAYECGDLRIAHGLPAHRTRSRAWAPALLYNSQHAHPRPTVYADVTVPVHTLAPDSVEMVVTMAGGAVHRATFAGAGFLPGLARRVGVQWDALHTGTGLYAYTVRAISHFPSGPVASATLAGEVAIVNRAESYFGAGWWLAGLERIYCVPLAGGGCRTLWVGGDGSTRVYEPAAIGAKWVAQLPGRGADTLALEDSGYVRRMPGGGHVYFASASGLHYKTVNRLGQTTRFAYGAHGVTGIYAPGAGAGGPGTGDPAWTMTWDNTALLVRGITATVAGAPARTTTITLEPGGRRVTALTDPDGGLVRFGYDTNVIRRINRQRDRREGWTFYGYDGAGKLSTARTQVGTGAVAAMDPVTSFAAAESRGVAVAGASKAPSAVAAQAHTRIDGPRTDVSDVTSLWLTSTGAVRRVRDALGAETFVQHGDARYPALATRVYSTSTGMVTTATYDHRGRATSTTVAGAYGGGETSTTSTEWDPVCERPTRTRSPGADTVHAGYDPVTCNVLWQRQGPDTARTVSYAYHPAGHAQAGQLDSVVGPRDAQGERAVERVRYDARGNVRMTISPLGFLTLFRRDALGRDSVVYTPVADDASARDTALLKLQGARQEIRYDVMDRVRETVAHGPRILHGHADLDSTAAEWLRVVTVPDAEGLPLSVTRTVSPNPAGLEPQVAEYRYDVAGRKTDEWTTPLMRHQYTHDFAGNVLTHTNPRLGVTTTRYDALGRPLGRVVQGAFWPRMGGSCPLPQVPDTVPANLQFSCDRMVFPFYPNQGTGYAIPEEYTAYRYDRAGNMRYAENADAVVQRTYHPNGQLRGDTLFIRDPATTALQAYGLRYDYDTSTGQMLHLHHPAALAGSASTDTYQYDPGTALLSGVVDRMGNAFSFVHDRTGRMTAMGMPGGIADTRVYDVEGRLRTRRTTSPAHGGVPLQDEAYTYDARDKVRQVATQATVGRSTPTVYTQWYSGLGNLVMTDWDNVDDPQWQRERFDVDPLGNMVRKHTFRVGTENPGNDHPDYAYTLHPVQGHVTAVKLVDVTTHPAGTPGGPLDETRYTYDAAGNQETSWQREDGPDASTGGYRLQRVVDSRSYHAHDGKLRAFQQYSESFASNPPKGSGLWEEYRYDPLGRRIMVVTRRPPELCNVAGTTCFGSVTRFVWYGDQLLWELKSAEGPYAAESGGTVSYTHGGGIDRPLAITKNGVGSIIPHENWRGQMARGTYGAGTGKPLGQSSDCTSYPPVSCVPVPWPGWNTSAWHEEASRPELTGTEHYWLGSLAVGMRDASGQMYKRNRYYDPAKGQFTQPDPIGLAGGLNVYGFAAGDPVTYDDPYGLCPIGGWRSWFRRTTRTDDCPQNSTGNALRTIGRYGGNQGAAVLQLIVSNEIDVSTRAGERFRRRCGGADGACIQGRTLILDEALTNGDKASAIVHEVVHKEMDAPYGAEEPIAAGAQMQFMDKLPEHERANSRYLKQHNLWKSDTSKWYETICYSIQVSGSGSCQ